jgi:hypothetical protein
VHSSLVPVVDEVNLFHRFAAYDRNDRGAKPIAGSITCALPGKLPWFKTKRGEGCSEENAQQIA